MTRSSYHHGDLRAALLGAAAAQIEADGLDSVSLRGLARRAEVSHAAPAHHFGDRAGLFTALATEGFLLLADELSAAEGDFGDVALAYVRFALSHPGHFDVMFRRDVVHADDPGLVAARAASGAALRRGASRLAATDLTKGDSRGRLGSAGHDADADTDADTDADADAVSIAAWSLVHGLVTLWRDGALPASGLTGDADPDQVARRMLSVIRLG